MRVSTSMLAQSAVGSLQKQQAAVAKTQMQLATGQRLQNAADDPSGAATAVGLDQASAQYQRYQTQIDTARNRLSLEENVLADSGTLLQRVREIAVELNNGTQSSQTRGILGNELRNLREQLMSYANSDDGQGRYLFGGSQDGVAPFSGSSGASYAGDQQQRLLQVTGSRSVADADPGSEVFLRLRDGNGTFTVNSGNNSGTAGLKSARLTDASLWDGGSYTLSFSGGNYEVRDAGSAVISSGTYTEGQAIAFRGVDLSFTGTPADGDSFQVGASGQRDVFAQIDELARIAGLPQDTAAQRAQVQTAMHQSLTAIDATSLHLSDVRASVGNRLAVLDDAEAQNAAQNETTQAALSSIRDLDYAEAATRLSQQLTALQAAQQTFARVQGLSLFDYLR
ncbi:flagellar hook-associated protein 3 [Solimonas sp. K1W22B-7]|uniref:flagellar hook-associated protein FlgL n=1 Tax=Solimonas sp. K1W22B-7 TaxID=2303331 RepID=UPI000E337A3F|nr:flagellar hook-associated protein FlgL [Solimonas sp. K1W22B-7]AXQ30397.1 flagellar hook-associated protein 3 [Solimonas sp. K1W22B-7]